MSDTHTTSKAADTSVRDRNAVIAEKIGYEAYLERRGEYELAVVRKPGDREPWKSRQNSEAQKVRYRKVSCLEATRKGFFGIGFPRFSLDADAAFSLIIAMRAKGFRYEVASAEDGGHLANFSQSSTLPDGSTQIIFDYGDGPTPMAAVANAAHAALTRG